MSIVRPSLGIILAPILFLNACGDGEASASADAPAQGAQTAQAVMGAFQLPDTTLAFRLTRCDLTGTAQDGILARGSGTMPDGTLLLPDGRTMSIEVERLTPEDGSSVGIYERATVRFGSMMDEDAWEATALSGDGTSWSTGDRRERLEGPIIQVSGNELKVAAMYRHESRDEQLEGTLRVTCPGPTYP